VKIFETKHTLEQIKEVVARMKCGKIDQEYAQSLKTKAQLLAYLHMKECPALRQLEIKMAFT
jgi:hypothetical protein